MQKVTTKERVLALLSEHRGSYYSGQEIADKLQVSRNAVWKAIESLRAQDIPIVGSTKLGYSLNEQTDVLITEEVVKGLSGEAAGFYSVECVKVTESTNADVKLLGAAGAKEGACRISEEQTKGRGRKGRSFYSPGATGLYLSILLRPRLGVEDSVLITTAAAVAAAIACEKANPALKEQDIKIKWVNDLFLNSKKICGILTEASFSIENNGFDYAVLGIGFNLADPRDGWPEEIRNVAGSLFKTEEIYSGMRNVLASAFLEEFYKVYSKLPSTEYLDEYRRRQLAINSEVLVLEADGTSRKAYCVGVDDRCRLLVKYEESEEPVALFSGEISIKLNTQK